MTMNTAEYVDNLIADLKARAVPFSEAAWQTAIACVGWPYVFGSWGALCTLAERKKRYRDDHSTIKTDCPNWMGAGTCDGCKWYPGGKRVRCYDCRGFTDWVLKQFGFDLIGEGATGQWDTAKNWKGKGMVKDGIPQGVIVCLFYPDKKNPKKMAHTGLYFNGETCECSSGVQHFKTINKKWTHWAVPAYDATPAPAPTPPDPDAKPTLRRGSKGEYVTLAQTMLMQRGYKLPKYGADGSFGAETQAAVKAFQQDWGLEADGIIGPDTWKMLESSPVKIKSYSVTIKGLDLTQARAIMGNYPGSEMREE